MTVAQLELSLTRRELIGWMEYFTLWPSGEDAMDFRFAYLNSLINQKLNDVIANIPTFSKARHKKPKKFSPRDLSPIMRHGIHKKKETTLLGKSPEEVASTMRNFGKSLQGSNVKRGR